MLEATIILKEHNLKVTPQRLAILTLLKSTHVHPSAETIYTSLQEAHPTMSLATVYKTLDSFVQNGLVQQLNIGEDSYRYDANTTPHSHLKCIHCNNVIDIHKLTDSDNIKSEVEARTGYKLLREQFYFFGICPTCQKTENQGEL